MTDAAGSIPSSNDSIEFTISHVEFEQFKTSVSYTF